MEENIFYIVKVVVIAIVFWLINNYANPVALLKNIIGWVIIGVAILLCLTPTIDIIRYALNSIH
jgi:hypothetical protein